MELQIKIEEDLNTAQQLLKEGNYTDALELLNKCNWLSHENSSEFKKYNKEELDILILKIFSELDKANEIYAEYFSSNRAVVFNQTANIKEIDSLMEKF